MKVVAAALLASAVMACGDVEPLGPSLPGTPPPTPVAAAPVRDALERVVPTLGSSGAAAELQHALSAVLSDESAASRAAVEGALQRLVAEQPDAAVEADVIRLAISAQP